MTDRTLLVRDCASINPVSVFKVIMMFVYAFVFYNRIIWVTLAGREVEHKMLPRER